MVTRQQLEVCVKIGILGAGKVGTILARLTVEAGYETCLAASGDPADIDLIASVLAPGATTATSAHAADQADLVIVAIPLRKHDTLPVEQLRGKIVVDAMNYWWETDGRDSPFGAADASTSEFIQSQLPESTVVKAFNHMGYHDLDELGRPAGDPDRRAIAVAGPRAAGETVMGLIDDVGFDPLYIGGLPEGVRLQPFSPAFGANGTRAELGEIIENFPATERGREVYAALGR